MEKRNLCGGLKHKALGLDSEATTLLEVTCPLEVSSEKHLNIRSYHIEVFSEVYDRNLCHSTNNKFHIEYVIKPLFKQM